MRSALMRSALIRKGYTRSALTRKGQMWSGHTRRAALLAPILIAAWLAGAPPPPLAAQESQDVARLTGEIGVDPEPGSLLASTARLSIEQVPLAEALVRLAERSRVQIAFSPSLLPPDRVVDCACATKNVARTLDELLARTDLGYVELGSQVIVVPRALREASPLDAIVGGKAGPEAAVAVADAPPDPQAAGETADSLVYLDETARRLMEGARAARDSALSDIESYTATIRERNSVAFSMLVRDRPFLRQESATRVRWSRNEPTVLRVLGSRMEIGGQRFRPARPEGVAARFAADPLRDPFGLFVLSGLGARTEESWFVPSVTPLDDDAEGFYQFRSGDTISVRFAGRSVQAVSVTAHPRAQHLGLVFAVLWIEPETFGVVRTIYRPAKPIDSEFSLRKRSGSLLGLKEVYQGKPLGHVEAPSPPRRGLSGRILDYALNAAISTRMEIGVPVAVVDYSMWNLRYWLPRRASFAHYAITGDVWETRESERVMMQGVHDWDFEIEQVSTGAGDPQDPRPAAEDLVKSWREEGDTVVVKDGSQSDSGTVVITPRDWQALSASDLLPPSIWEERESGLYGSTIDEAGEVLDSIGFARGTDDLEGAETDQDISQWHFEAPILTPRLMRYNTIEGLSVGSRLVRDFSWGRGALTVRTGTRRAEPSIDLAAEYGRTGPRVRFSLYHTLREAGGTVTAQRPPRWEYAADPSTYYVVRGAAMHLLPARSDRSWTSLTVFSETNTTLGGDARRRQGVDLFWRPWWGGLTGRRVNGGVDISLRGLVGDYPNVRLSVMGMLVLPLPADLSMALEAGGARIGGDPAPEEIWRLGSSGDWLRGYPQNVLSGRQVWRSRIELQRKVSLVALSVFHDWARVDDRSLQSAGVGVSAFNGFLRVDLARPLAPWYREGTPVPGKPRAGIDWAHQPEWEWHFRFLAPF